MVQSRCKLCPLASEGTKCRLSILGREEEGGSDICREGMSVDKGTLREARHAGPPVIV